MTYGPKPRPIEDRFWAKVAITPGCWMWTGCKQTRGYGVFYIAPGRKARAHRFAYELLVGPVPEDLVLDHLCRNHSCVNPDHLEPVTQGENVRRGKSPMAINAKATHCAHGHEFNESNTYHTKEGYRQCRACRKAYHARTGAIRYQRRKAREKKAA